MSRWCPRGCGQEFSSKKDLFHHLRDDDCENLVKEQAAVDGTSVVPNHDSPFGNSAAPEGRPHHKAEGREGDGSGRPLLHDREPLGFDEPFRDPAEVHQTDLSDYTDWGEE